jgi:hypothetical protein
VRQWFSETKHRKARGDQKQKFSTELPIFNHIGVGGPLFGPWLNERVANQPDETLNGKENKETEENIVKGFHAY